ncbi:hypothetical protein BIY24_10255 [Halobacteriovorax marinus]|nr:hypothetical protein BIY24_10255 [Halobacteriovorax marinus]
MGELARMKMVFILFTLLICKQSFSQERVEKVHVNSLRKSSGKGPKKLLLLFREKAAIYKAEPKYFKCFNYSIQSKSPILIKYNMSNLEILGCKTRKK